MKRVVVLTIALVCSFLVRADAADRPISDSDGVLAVYVRGASLSRIDRTALVMAIWSDGYAVWSADRVNGGAPYYAASVAPEKYAATIEHLQANGALSKSESEIGHVGPDSDDTKMVVRSSEGNLLLYSWHEMYEQSDSLVAHDGGISTLNGRKRWNVLRNGSQEYAQFRLEWAETRLAISNLLPPTGRQVKGELIGKRGRFSWRSLDGYGLSE